MAPTQLNSSSNLLLRKRTSDAARRRSGQLGAVKKTTEAETQITGTHSDRKITTEIAKEVEPLPETSTATTETVATEDAGGDASATTHFERLLSVGDTSEAWFDEQLTPKNELRCNSKLHGSTSAGKPPVQSAASQIVDKALKLFTAERGAAGVVQPTQPLGASYKIGSASILDKGLDAINGVGKLMESFAVTLDGVIGQAFEEWGTPKSADRARPLQPHNPKAHPAAGLPGKDTPSTRNSSVLKQTHMTSFINCVSDASDKEVADWHKRVVGLQSELQKLQNHIQENQRLKEQYNKIQQDLQQTTTAISKLEEENTLLKQQSSHGSDCEANDVDFLAAEQVRLQLEALLTEKAKLAQENARLLRENNGLQELLEFTMLAQSENVGDDELFGEDQQSACMWSEPPFSSAGTSPRSAEGCGVTTPTTALAQLAL